ncbi:Uncharacterised protein [uncultured archaeon]|nr:Uncharacterised protein [uncultured archaeon]
MSLTRANKVWLFILVVGLFYICFLSILIDQTQVVFERTVLLVFLAAGVALILSMALSSVGINMKKFRFLPIEIYGIKMSITFFLFSIIILKVLVG